MAHFLDVVHCNSTATLAVEAFFSLILSPVLIENANFKGDSKRVFHAHVISFLNFELQHWLVKHNFQYIYGLSFKMHVHAFRFILSLSSVQLLGTWCQIRALDTW